MMEERLQLWLDQALATCRQRWVLGALAVASVVAASLLAGIGVASARGLTIFLATLIVAAIVAMAGSGTHIGSVVVALVALQWVAYVDDVTSARAVGVATCLYLFHALLALTATTRHTAAIDARILRRWALRSVVVIAATVAVWALVVVFDRRQTTGSETLTFAGLFVIVATLFAIRRGLPPTTHSRLAQPADQSDAASGILGRPSP